MIYFYWIAGLLLAVVWASRVIGAGLGMPSVAEISRPEWNNTNLERPRVSVIVPARNEEASIEQTLTSLVDQDYANFEVIAINDRSTDSTGEIIERIAAPPAAAGRLKTIHICDLPLDWMGKAHAMWVAAQQAGGEWLLFTDADIGFRSDCLRRAMNYAQQSRADHVVLFPTLEMHSIGERMMLAFFQILFVFGHRPWRVADPAAKDHMGIGAFNLLRRAVYDAVGTHRKLRFEVLDDMKLGKLVKENGFAQRNVEGRGLITLRWATNAMGVVRNLTKNFFALMEFRWPRALGACLLLAFLNWMPFLGIWLVPGWARVPYPLALFSMFLIYVGVFLHTAISPGYFLLHPIATLLFMYTMARSMCLTLWRGGVMWRGTFYPLAALRRGLV